MENRQDILKDYVGDMLAVEKHCLEALERQTHSDRLLPYEGVFELLTKIECTVRMHVFALERYLSSIDGDGGPMVKKAATMISGFVGGLYGIMRPEDPISRSLRDDYTNLHLVAMSYTMLHTLAQGVGESELGEMTLRHLNELTPLIVSLYELIPRVVAVELSEEGKIPTTSAWQDTVANARKAWSRDVIGQYH